MIPAVLELAERPIEKTGLVSLQTSKATDSGKPKVDMKNKSFPRVSSEIAMVLKKTDEDDKN